MSKDNILSSSKFFLFIFSYAKRLHPKNCLGVRQFAETMMCAVLYDAATSFVHQHFVEVSMSEEFLALPLEDVLELVSRDELNVRSEEQVCRAQWPSAGDGGAALRFLLSFFYNMKMMVCVQLLFVMALFQYITCFFHENSLYILVSK